MNFQEIYGEAASNFPTSSTSRVKTACNAAYHEVLGARQWSWRESTGANIALQAGVAAYQLTGTTPLVTDFGGLISASILSNGTGSALEKLFEWKQADFDRVCGRMVTNGEPTFYTIRGDTPNSSSAAMVAGGQTEIVVSPPPLATANHGTHLVLRYFRSVDSCVLTAPTDIPLLPVSLHYAIVLGGIAYMASAIGDKNKALTFRGLFTERIKEAMKDDEGLRMRDSELLTFAPSVSIYPISGQNPQTFDRSTRPYDE